MTRTEHIENQAYANRRWFSAALCYLDWARDSKQPPAITLDLLTMDIASLAKGDHHAALKCLEYAAYKEQPTTPHKPRRSRKQCDKI